LSNWDSHITLQLGYKHTFYQNVVSTKKCITLYFCKKNNILHIGLLRICQIFSTSCTTVYWRININCCFMSSNKNMCSCTEILHREQSMHSQVGGGLSVWGLIIESWPDVHMYQLAMLVSWWKLYHVNWWIASNWHQDSACFVVAVNVMAAVFYLFVKAMCNEILKLRILTLIF